MSDRALYGLILRKNLFGKCNAGSHGFFMGRPK